MNPNKNELCMSQSFQTTIIYTAQTYTSKAWNLQVKYEILTALYAIIQEEHWVVDLQEEPSVGDG